AGVLGRGAVGGFEDRVAGQIVDVGARRDADPAHLRGEGVGDVVAVQVHRGDDAVLLGTRQDLLQERVGDYILHDYTIRQPAPGAAVDLDGAVLLPGHLIPPVPEAALGELHDVALVDQRHVRLRLCQRVVDGAADQPLRSLFGDRLDPNGAGLG